MNETTQEQTSRDDDAYNQGVTEGLRIALRFLNYTGDLSALRAALQAGIRDAREEKSTGGQGRD